MSFDVEVNPPGIAAAYLDGLNRSFGHWGNAGLYRWAFDRTVGAPPADLFVLRDGDELLAGSAVSYRLTTGAGTRLVGIMTGSWTLPEARGRGAFSHVIDVSRALVQDRGGAELLAFVTHRNASYRRLVASGASEHTTAYLSSSPDAPSGAIDDVEPATADPSALHDAHRAWQERGGGGGGAAFAYPTVDEWRGQFLERPVPVELVRAAGADCVLEVAPTTDRVLLLLGPDRERALAALLGRAGRLGRGLFVFSTEDDLTAAAVALGMEHQPGSITTLPVDVGGAGGSGEPRLWRLQGGDRV